MTGWQGEEVGHDPVALLLKHLAPLLSPGGIVAVCGRKDLRVHSATFKKIEKIRAGKRLIYVMQRIDI